MSPRPRTHTRTRSTAETGLHGHIYKRRSAPGAPIDVISNMGPDGHLAAVDNFSKHELTRIPATFPDRPAPEHPPRGPPRPHPTLLLPGRC